MDNEQQPTNQERAPTEIPRDNLNNSYASLTIRSRRNQRRLRHEITVNMYILNRIRRLPMQNTNDLFTNQFFNGSTFP
ncbi:unnamed protein product [Rhizophagus irregularis]|nr:unnamed protein product [Rhizophagus irregularis]